MFILRWYSVFWLTSLLSVQGFLLKDGKSFKVHSKYDTKIYFCRVKVCLKTLKKPQKTLNVDLKLPETGRSLNSPVSSSVGSEEPWTNQCDLREVLCRETTCYLNEKSGLGFLHSRNSEKSTFVGLLPPTGLVRSGVSRRRSETTVLWVE